MKRSPLTGNRILAFEFKEELGRMADLAVWVKELTLVTTDDAENFRKRVMQTFDDCARMMALSTIWSSAGIELENHLKKGDKQWDAAPAASISDLPRSSTPATRK